MTTPTLIAIAGGSGSGKSRLARTLEDALAPHAATLTIDHFYHDLSHLPEPERDLINFDDPATIDWPAVEATLELLAAAQPAPIPRYDFATHTRHPQTDTLAPASVIILEGLWPLTRPAIRNLCHLTLFVDCSAELRLSRRIQRDTRERGRSETSVRRQFADHVGPMHDLHVQPQAALAHRVLSSPISREKIVDLLQTLASFTP